VLGVGSNASLGEIKQAYRGMIAQYHPDRLHGLASELRTLAEARAKEINAADAEACGLRGE
jgi:curved DNA-binding protein CbpA